MRIALEQKANKSLFNNQASSFARAMRERTISAFSDDNIIKGLKNVYKKIGEKYPELKIKNISVQTKGGLFDLLPNMIL